MLLLLANLGFAGGGVVGQVFDPSQASGEQRGALFTMPKNDVIELTLQSVAFSTTSNSDVEEEE